MDKQSLAIVVQSICRRMGLDKPTNTIIRNVQQFCNKKILQDIRKEHPDNNEFLLAIVKAYMESIKPQEDFDYETYSKMQIPAVNETISRTWLQANAPTDVCKSESIYIDTQFRRVYNSGLPITNFEFNLVPRGMQSIIGDGNIQTRVMPSQVTYFKLGNITIPYTSTMRTANYMKEITMAFNALSSNGILVNSQTFHFTFTYTVVSDSLVTLTPINKYCKFSPPLRLLDSISFRLSDPLIPISFTTDRMIAASLNYLSADGRITFDTAHNLTTGDVVIVQGLVTGDNTTDAQVLAQIMNPRGLAITVINPTVIAIGIDFTTITTPDPLSLPMVIFFSKTFRFQMEIGYQDMTEL